MAEEKKEVKKEKSSSLDFNAIIVGALASVASIFRKVPENYVERDTNSWLKYLVWLVLGLSFIFVLYLIFKKRK